VPQRGPTISRIGRVNKLLKKLGTLFSTDNVNSRLGRAPKPRKKTYQMSNSEYHLTSAELEKLIRAGRSERDITILRLFAETGIRRFELAELRAGNIDAKNLLITVRNGKGNKTRQIPITDALAVRLTALMNREPSSPLFVSAGGKGLSLRQINRIVAVAARRAGIKQLNPRYKNINCHMLRHSFARLWKNSGGSIETLSKLMGHSDTRLTWRAYGTESIFDIKKNYQKTMRRMFRN